MLKSPVNSLFNYKNTTKPKLFSQDFVNICSYGYRTKDKKLWLHCGKEKSITSNMHLHFIITVKLTWTLMTSESLNLLMNHLMVWFEIILTRWFVWAQIAKEKFLFMIIFLMFYDAAFQGMTIITFITFPRFVNWMLVLNVLF